MPNLQIAPIQNQESGLSVRDKLNALLLAIANGDLLAGSDYAADVAALIAAIQIRLTTAENAADAAAEDAVESLARVEAVEAIVNAFGSDVLDRAQALVDALEEFDIDKLSRAVGMALAGQRDGWAVDPKFQEWASGVPLHWTSAGLPAYGGPAADGHYGAGLSISAPTGSATVNLTAASNVAGQLTGADPKHQFVAVSVMMKCLSGSLAGAEIRPEWLVGATWTRGKAFGDAAALGKIGEPAQWGFEVDPNRVFSKTAIFERPAVATAVRLVVKIKQASPLDAVTVRLDAVDVRGLTDAEVLALGANTYADAAVEELRVELLDPADGALAALSTVLRAEFASGTAAVSDSLLALSTAVSSQASRITTIESGFNDGNLVRNSRFVDGARAAGVAPNYWTMWPAAYRVAARSEGGTALGAAPTQFVAAVGSGSTLETARAFVGQPVKALDRVVVSFQAAGTTAGANFVFAAYVEWRNAVGTFISADSRTHAVTGTTWVVTNLADFIAPAGAATMELSIRRMNGGSGGGLFTNVEARFVDRVARAAIETAQSTASDAGSAVAVMQAQATASFGSFSDMVTQTATAVATVDGAYTAYVIRNIGGSFGFYSWNDKTGVGAALRVDAAQVLLPGSVSMGELTITDLRYNKVPDNQVQSRTAWSGTADGFSVVPNGTIDGFDSSGEILWNWSSGSEDVSTYSAPFTVRPAQVLDCSFEVARAGNGSIAVVGRVRFMTKAGVLVTNSTIANVVNSTAGIQARTGQVTVPSGAYRAQFFYTIQKSGTTVPVRLASPSVIVKTNASVLITPDGAFMNQLSAYTAWIGEANIIDGSFGTLKIGANAVTIPLFVRRASALQVESTGYVNAMDFDVPMSHAGFLHATATLAFDQDTGPLQGLYARLIIDGSVVFEGVNFLAIATAPVAGAKFVAAGTRNVRVQVRLANASPFVDVTDATCVCVGAKR